MTVKRLPLKKMNPLILILSKIKTAEANVYAKYSKTFCFISACLDCAADPDRCFLCTDSLTLSQTSPGFYVTCLQYKSFENIVEKG